MDVSNETVAVIAKDLLAVVIEQKLRHFDESILEADIAHTYKDFPQRIDKVISEHERPGN